MFRWLGRRFDILSESVEPWDPAIGSPLAALVPQWPRSNTPRIDARYRILGEPDCRPIASRIFGFLNYTNNSTYSPGLGPVWQEYFFGDLEIIDTDHFRVVSELSQSLTRFEIEIEYLDPVPETGQPGVRHIQTIMPAGVAPKVRTIVWNSVSWNYTSGATPNYIDPPQRFGAWPAPWISCDLAYHGMAHCYPVETLDWQELNVSNELAGILTSIVPSQSINGGVELNLSAPRRELGGQWWDPLGDIRKIVVPSPFNYVKVIGHIGTGTARVNSISLSLFLNGSSAWPDRCVAQERTSTIAQNTDLNVVTPDWVAVSPGDLISIFAAQTGGGLNSGSDHSWIQVRGAYFIS